MPKISFRPEYYYTAIFIDFSRIYSARGENFYLKKRKFFVRTALLTKNLPQIRLFAFNSPFSAFGRPFFPPENIAPSPGGESAFFRCGRLSLAAVCLV